MAVRYSQKKKFRFDDMERCRMCGRPIRVQESVNHQHGPRCYRKYQAMGSPVQTEFEFSEPSRLFKPEMSMMEQHQRACEILYKWQYRAE